MRRSARRLAVLLTALFLVLAPAALPGGGTAVAESSGGSGGDPFVVVTPSTMPDAKSLPTYARRIIRHPMGEELHVMVNRFALLPKPPVNTQVVFFTFGWMDTSTKVPSWVRERYRDFMSQLPEEMRSPSTPPKWNYPLHATMVDAENYGYDDLFEELGEYPVDRYGNEQVLELATGSGGRDRHSEDAMDEWFSRTIRNTLGRIARSADERGQVDKVLSVVKREASAGIAGQRGFCDVCKERMSKRPYNFRSRLFIAEYDKSKGPQAKLANSAIGRLKPHLKTAYDEYSEEKIDKALNKVGLTPPCSPVNNPGSMNIAAAPMASPCDEAGSGLSGALGSPSYGGVDFSSLQLRYLSDDGSSQVKYAFSADAAKEGLKQDPRTGGQTLLDSMGALRTWLALSPDKFWVNLNPGEPDRIIDAQLGRTNAGRALLEADWQMKRSTGRLLDPKTSFGAEYWRRLSGSSGPSCYSSRMWIVPGTVEVRQDGSSLYVLKAALDVKAKPETIAGLEQDACNTDPAETARNARVEQEMVVPRIVKAVNTAPEYAPLRQVFLARVVAQWIRDRHAEGESTSFDELIDSGDLGSAVETGAWKPQQVYDTYVRSIREGSFTYRQTTRVGDTTVTYVMRTGGVDFSKLSPARLSAADMNRRVPGLPETVAKSARRPATAADGSIWLADTAEAPAVSTWDRVRDYATGRTGIVVMLVAALGILLFFVRDGSAFRRRPPGRPGTPG
ncbi:hypothetical protein [Streptomyces sp. NPDC046887]|uniref:hypothetical protein n=1 Tax=Streptomyces sp. NPDC046887 TaxID=3155472 RepID=UPI0033DF6CCC